MVLARFSIRPPPPVSHTGVETPSATSADPEIGWGWMRGTVPDADPWSIAHLVDPAAEPRARAYGSRHYGLSLELGTDGTLVFFQPRQRAQERAHEVLVDISQTALDSVGWVGGRELA